MNLNQTKEIVKTIASCYHAWVYRGLDEKGKNNIHYEWHSFFKNKEFGLIKKAIMLYAQVNKKIPEIYDIENTLLKIN